MFSQSFFAFLVMAALLWTALGSVALIVLLIKDWVNKDLW